MTTLLDTNTCKVIYKENADFFTIRWIGFPKSKEFRTACNFILDEMKKKNIKKLLTNNSQAKLFAVDDQKWLNNDWLPRAEKTGYYCSAVVSNDDVFIKSALRNITAKRDATKFLSNYFSSEEEAEKWLATV